MTTPPKPPASETARQADRFLDAFEAYVSRLIVDGPSPKPPSSSRDD
ncbi:MAG: hypothetical protein AAGJ96_03140 [Pseudomonadota bacterium]